MRKAKTNIRTYQPARRTGPEDKAIQECAQGQTTRTRTKSPGPAEEQARRAGATAIDNRQREKHRRQHRTMHAKSPTTNATPYINAREQPRTTEKQEQHRQAKPRKGGGTEITRMSRTK